MLPMLAVGSRLSGLIHNGTPIAFTTETIKGMEYACFNAGPGSYAAFCAGNLTLLEPGPQRMTSDLKIRPLFELPSFAPPLPSAC
jgi:hypothetical protein